MTTALPPQYSHSLLPKAAGLSVAAFVRIQLPNPADPKRKPDGLHDIKIHTGSGNPYAVGHPFGDYVGVGNALGVSPVENKQAIEGSELQLQLVLPGEEERKQIELDDARRTLIVQARNADFEDAPMVLYVAVSLADGTWPGTPTPILYANVSEVSIEPALITVSAYTSAMVLDKIWYESALQEDWSQRAFRNPKDGVYRYNTRALADTGIQF